MEPGKQFVQTKTDTSMGKQAIQKEGQSVQNRNQKIKQEVNERANIGATKAAINQLKDTWSKKK
jgi:hypothetical protein